MKELLRTNDAVLISYVSALLSGAGIEFMVADANMSVLEGSLAVLPRRILVKLAAFERARRALQDAGIGDVLEDASGS